jgi:tetratricopeptide (TPR) repeat protein
LPEIARELNVDAVVEGSVQSSGDRVSITVRLIAAGTEKRLWSKSFERELRDVLILQKEVALAVAGEIEAQVTPQEQTLFGEARAVDPEAYKHYIWGLSFWDKSTPESSQQAVKHYEQAIAIDPNFAQAYAALAVPYFLLGLMHLMPMEEAKSKARQAVAKALELDETLTEAHTAMGVLREVMDWDWSGAEEEFRHAIKLNPGSGGAHYEYGLLLSRIGRTEEGLAELMLALKLNPLSESVNVAVVWAYVHNRQHDEAIEHCLRVLQLHPDFAQVQFYLGLPYLAKGRYDEAIAAFERNAMDLGYRGSAYALSGKREKALKLLEELQARLEQGVDAALSSMAMIYASLGEKDKALTMLERDFELREFSSLIYLIRGPIFDPLRAEPRLQALLKKMGLEK